MSDHTIRQSTIEATLQSARLPEARNPAEAYIFTNVSVTDMLESPDGTIEYFDARGDLVAVLDASGNAYVIDGDAWRFVSIDEIIEGMAATVIDAEEETDLPDAAEMVCRAPEASASTAALDGLMSIAPEDLYCDAAEMVCRAPEIDEGGQTERSAKRFSSSPPDGSSSQSAEARSDEHAPQSAESSSGKETARSEETDDARTETITLNLDDGEEGAVVDDVDGAIPADEIERLSEEDDALAGTIAEGMPGSIVEGAEQAAFSTSNALDLSAAHYMTSQRQDVLAEMYGASAKTAAIGVGGEPSAGSSAIPLGGMSVFGVVDAGCFRSREDAFDAGRRAAISGTFMMATAGSPEVLHAEVDGAGRLADGAIVVWNDARPGEGRVHSTRRSFSDLQRPNGRHSVLDELFREQGPAEFDPFVDTQATAAFGGMPHSMASIPGTVAFADVAEKALKLEVEPAHARGDANDHQQEGEQQQSDDDAWTSADDIDFEEIAPAL